jgi:hypothetical protein
MSYFKHFPRTYYTFGTEAQPDVFENIARYSDVIDQVRDATTTYEDYFIQGGERPDQVSMKLYDNPNFHWTFYLLNTKLREGGWPLSQRKIREKALKDYKDTILTTRTKLTDKFKLGQTITGLTSGATAVIRDRNIDLGQLWIGSESGTFIVGETITSDSPTNGAESIVLTSTAPQYNTAHHYENADGEWVDIDPEVGPGAQLTEVTWFDRLRAANEAQKNIKVLRNDTVIQVVKAFREAVRS